MLAEVVADGSTEKLNKMMEAGELDPTQVMPLFAQLAEETADANGAYEKSLDSARTAQRRLRFEYEQFVKVFYTQGGEDGFSKVFNSFAKFLRENGDIAKGLGETWERFGSIVERVMVGIDNLADGFSMLSQKFGVAEGNMLGLSVVALTLMTRFGRIAAAAGVLFLVLEDISVGMKGGESYTKDFIDFLDANAWAEVTVKVSAFAASLLLVASAIGKIGKGIAVVGGVGTNGQGGTSMVSTILNIITKHPIMAALVAATVALNVASDVYTQRADSHLKGVIERADPNTAEDLKRLSSGKVDMKDIARANPDFYRDYPSGKLPGINQPMMMVDKISIEVKGTANPQETAELVLEKIKEYTSNAIKNTPLTE